jgi:hypothetical protein
MSRTGYDLSNQRFNRLTVIKRSGTLNKKVLWECVCDCGKTAHIRTNDLMSGNSQSCGCFNDERIADSNRSHGMTNTKLYKVWCGIKQRCEYKNHIGYKYYGARGIKMSERWRVFSNFYDDMSEGYEEGLSIDRVDTDGDYCKENCKWSTNTQQANNKSNNRMLTVDGVTDTLANTCRIHKLNYVNVLSQLHDGKTIEEIMYRLRSV